ncbi:kinase-like domain-containing protein [Xylariaceae sp. FL1651]|nr:kinase-like domain-containing protein [Xylariaceae sp. FL1651]
MEYVPLQLPYFAPLSSLPAPLPSFEEIKSVAPSSYSLDRLIIPIGQHFVVKLGTGIRTLEGENMLFVRNHSNVRVPTVYAIYKHGDVTVIIMEQIQGKPLSSVNPVEDQSISEKLRKQVNELRKIPPPGYYGSLGRRPYNSVLFGSRLGPFVHLNDFHDSFLHVWDQGLVVGDPSGDARSSVQRRFRELAERHGKPVFTHGDLAPRNILYLPDGSLCIIDWETAAWYPLYWEYLESCRFNDHVDFLEKFSEERELLNELWHL